MNWSQGLGNLSSFLMNQYIPLLMQQKKDKVAEEDRNLKKGKEQAEINDRIGMLNSRTGGLGMPDDFGYQVDPGSRTPRLGYAPYGQFAEPTGLTGESTIDPYEQMKAALELEKLQLGNEKTKQSLSTVNPTVNTATGMLTDKQVADYWMDMTDEDRAKYGDNIGVFKNSMMADLSLKRVNGLPPAKEGMLNVNAQERFQGSPASKVGMSYDDVYGGGQQSVNYGGATSFEEFMEWYNNTNDPRKDKFLQGAKKAFGVK